jgi:hypothetical protein
MISFLVYLDPFNHNDLVQRFSSADPNAERRLRNNAEGMRKNPRSVWGGPLELIIERSRFAAESEHSQILD